MVTVSHTVRKILHDEPMIEESLRRGLINYTKLAAYLRPRIEAELGKPVKGSAIIMAIKRAAEEITGKRWKHLKQESFVGVELGVKSNLKEISILKSPTCFESMRKLYGVVDLERGEVLNVTYGNSEATIIYTKKNDAKIKENLAGERTLMEESELAQLSIRYPAELMDQPGLFALITMELAWHGINIVEVVSTYTELILVLKERDVVKAYGHLQLLFGQHQAHSGQEGGKKGGLPSGPRIQPEASQGAGDQPRR